MTDTGGLHFNQNFTSSGAFQLYGFYLQRFSGFKRHSSFHVHFYDLLLRCFLIRAEAPSNAIMPRLRGYFYPRNMWPNLYQPTPDRSTIEAD